MAGLSHDATVSCVSWYAAALLRSAMSLSSPAIRIKLLEPHPEIGGDMLLDPASPIRPHRLSGASGRLPEGLGLLLAAPCRPCVDGASFGRLESPTHPSSTSATAKRPVVSTLHTGGSKSQLHKRKWLIVVDEDPSTLTPPLVRIPLSPVPPDARNSRLTHHNSSAISLTTSICQTLYLRI